jgi:NTE family protein
MNDRKPARRRATRSPENNLRHVSLALQGGGSHGAFTWGVIDRLLREETIEIDGISGTGSGAINGAVVASGYAKGGAEGARKALEEFWQHWSNFSFFGSVHASLFDRFNGNWNLDESIGSLVSQFFERFVSPYQANPLNYSPMRICLGSGIDFESVRHSPVKLFASATNVRTGKIRVFEPHEITVDTLLASACLPQVEQAVIIDDEPYWDGGLMGNPPVFPLIYNCRAHDIVLVQLDPITHEGVPRSSAEITDRLNEITFNANLMREMRAIAFVTKLIDDGAKGKEIGRLRRMHVHMIGDEQPMRQLGFASKFNTDLAFLLYLKELGELAAEKWLDENLAAVGHRSTLDLREIFL